jgi:hypothetical protein
VFGKEMGNLREDSHGRDGEITGQQASDYGVQTEPGESFDDPEASAPMPPI